MKSVTLQITGMTCGHCENRVTEALQSVKGFVASSVELDDGIAEVDFNEDRAKSEDFVAAVDAAGYGATVRA